MLGEPALVLNRRWYPIGTTTVRDAMCMIFRASARALDPDDCAVHDFDSWASLKVATDEPCIRTVRLRIRVPEIIILTDYEDYPNRKVPFSRRNIYKRDKCRCQYCGTRPVLEDLTIDHIVPRSKGGRSTWTNCALACLRCNHRKSNRTLSQSGLTLRSVPHEPKWTPMLSIPVAKWKESWEQFVSQQYWNVELSD
jgi:5-methylcytosine-specific restriction endonuclease McrA